MLYIMSTIKHYSGGTRSHKEDRAIEVTDRQLQRSMSWNGIIDQEEIYVMTLVSYTTVKTNHIRSIPRMPELSEKAIAMFKHTLLFIMTPGTLSLQYYVPR